MGSRNKPLDRPMRRLGEGRKSTSPFPTAVARCQRPRSRAAERACSKSQLDARDPGIAMSAAGIGQPRGAPDQCRCELALDCKGISFTQLQRALSGALSPDFDSRQPLEPTVPCPRTHPRMTCCSQLEVQIAGWGWCVYWCPGTQRCRLSSLLCIYTASDIKACTRVRIATSDLWGRSTCNIFHCSGFSFEDS